MKDAIASALIPQKYVKGQVIVREGDMADSFYIIKEVIWVSIHPSIIINLMNKFITFLKGHLPNL